MVSEQRVYLQHRGAKIGPFDDSREAMREALDQGWVDVHGPYLSDGAPYLRVYLDKHTSLVPEAP